MTLFFPVSKVPPEYGVSDLQHGLVRWVQNYGEHILKTLIARSPKLPHPRRLSNPLATSPSSQNGYPSLGNPRPRPMRQDMGVKAQQRYSVRGGMLQPPYHHAQFIPPNFPVGNTHNSAFYVVPNQGQLSPPSGGVTGSSVMTTPTNTTGGIHSYPGGGMVVHMPSGHSPQGQGGLVYMQPPPAVESPSQPITSQPSSPILPPQAPGGGANSEGGEAGLYLVPQTQSLMSTMSPLMSTSAVPPLGASNSQHQLLPANQPSSSEGVAGGGGGQFEQSRVFSRPPVPPSMLAGSLFPLDPAAIPARHYLSHPQLIANTTPPTSHLPPPHPPQVSNASAHTPQGESEPLLPNPPLPPAVPLLPIAHPMQAMPAPPTGNSGGNAPTSFPPPSQPPPPQSQQHQHHGGSPLSSRKEILCRHYMQGNCPFGEKCWFAHPEPMLVGGGGVVPHPRGSEGPNGGQGMAPSPLHVQAPPNFWLNNQLIDYSMASPPQSPMNHTLMPRPPIIPALIRPRGSMAYPGQHPFLFLRGPMASNARGPGSNLPLLQAAPMPMPVNPVLKFSLLSQVTLQSYDGNSVITDVSQLATYADHFFVSYDIYINTYKIVFGGNRNFNVSA